MGLNDLIFNLDIQTCFKVMIDTFSVPLANCVISLPVHKRKKESIRSTVYVCRLMRHIVNEGNDY